MYKITCPFCGEQRTFTNVRDAVEWAIQHYRTYHFSLKCPICGVVFDSLEKLKRHVNSAHVCSCDKRKCWFIVATAPKLFLNQSACSCIPCLFDDPPSYMEEEDLCRRVAEY